jgi:hypothetical protein
MTLWRSSLRGKPQSGEDRIGGGAIGLGVDPIQHMAQTCSRLVDVVAVGDIDESFEQLFEAFGPAKVSGRRHWASCPAAWCTDFPHSFALIHPGAFPHGSSEATQALHLAG